MKHIFKIAIVVVAMSMFTACSKDHNCICTTTITANNSGEVVSSSSSGSVVNGTTRSARKECEGKNTSNDGGGFTTSTNCELVKR
ncbi:MAG: hypothetical protein ACK417_11900 [Bacteroidia bacterium]|jgi:uncharacterized lipoprotein YajG